MSDEVVEAAEKPNTKQSDECKKEILGAVAASRKLSPEDALTQLNEHRKTDGKDAVGEDSNPDWVKKNLRYYVQALILQKHGVTESARIRANRETSEASSPSEKPAASGRKRINTSGTFSLNLGDPPNFGREGSAKGTILRNLNDNGGEFTYDQFRAAVAIGYEYDSETETFAKETRFPTIQAATAAWFSELKNKAGLILQVGGES